MKGEAKAWYTLELNREELVILTLCVGYMTEAKLKELGVLNPKLVSEIYQCLDSIRRQS